MSINTVDNLKILRVIKYLCLLTKQTIPLVVVCLFFCKSDAQIKSAVQGLKNCGTESLSSSWIEWFSSKVQELRKSRINNISTTINYPIPVIVHILHNGDAIGANENISLAQTLSQIDILNADYAGTNSDISSVPQVFQTVEAGNTGIQFCLSQQTPNGSPLTEPGIERINWQERGWLNPNSFSNSTDLENYFDNTIKPNSYWDPGRYLNIWIADIGNSGISGYALYPSGTGLAGLSSSIETEQTSGVVINYKTWGNIETAEYPYDKVRTAVHEIGHYLGLLHIFAGICAGSLSLTCDNFGDCCCDTPPMDGFTVGCHVAPFTQNTCNEANDKIDMTMNYMDYTYDACVATMQCPAEVITKLQTKRLTLLLFLSQLKVVHYPF